MARELDFVDECYKDKDLSLLKKLTLVIPTYNRNYYLSRCLWYHAHFPFGQIIVADSSPEEKKVVNRETVAKIREMFGANVLYLEYQPETEKYGGDIYRKWADAVYHAGCEYTKICTDKEFVIPDTLADCIKFLDENSDYSSADGGAYRCIIPQSDEQTESEWEHWGPYDKSFDEDMPHERIMSAFNHTFAYRKYGSVLIILENIRRTSAQKELYAGLLKHNLNDIRFGDYGFGYVSLLHSKRKRLNEASLVRDISNYEANKTSESSYFRYPGIEEYVGKGIFETKMKSMREWIADILKTNSNYSDNLISECCNKIDMNFRVFFAGVEKHPMMKLYLDYTYHKLPDSLQNAGKKYISRLRKTSNTVKIETPSLIQNKDSQPFKTIEHCIKTTSSLHDTDIPVPLSQKDDLTNS